MSTVGSRAVLVETPQGQLVLKYPTFAVLSGALRGTLERAGASERLELSGEEVLALAPFEGNVEQMRAINAGREVVDTAPEPTVLEVGGTYLVEPLAGGGTFRATVLSLRGPLAVLRLADGAEALLRLDAFLCVPVE